MVNPAWARFATATAVWLAVYAPSAFSMNAALDVSHYVHTSWKIRSGFTRGTIRAIAQTGDGYLWLGTDVGLMRFDGVRVVEWGPPSNQQLPSNKILGLLAARDETLWIATDQGLASWRDGRLVRHEALAGSFVTTLVEDRDGTIWMMKFSDRWTLCEVQHGPVRCYGDDGGAGANALGLYHDRNGNLWVGTPAGVWRWRPGTPVFFPLTPERTGTGIQGFSEDRDGSLLIAYDGGIRRLISGTARMVYPFPSSMQPLYARQMLHDRDGGLWVATSARGLLRVRQGVMDAFSQSDGLSGDIVTALFEDREGTIWVATSGGLDRFRESPVVTYTAKQGLSGGRAISVLAAADRTLWVATFDGLQRWVDGRLSDHGQRDASGAAPLNSIFEDSQRRLWVSSRERVGYWLDGRFFAIDGVSGVTRAIVEDGDRTLWIAIPAFGLVRLGRGGGVERIPWATMGHDDIVSAVAADPSGSGVWIGYYRGSILFFKNGQVHASYDASAGLAAGRVSGLYVGFDGALWVAAAGGLSRVKDGRIATLTSMDGLPCDAIAWAIEDARHALWLATACGFVRIARSDVEAWVAASEKDASERARVQLTLFDQADGVGSFANASHFTAPVARSADGILWFVTEDGIGALDPARLPVNDLPPPVHIEQVIADRQTYGSHSDSGGPVQLPALIRDLQIDYTALSLVAPEKMRFRYKLEGHDRDWQEVGTRRQAFYNDLEPGTYRFRVTASNNRGVWNDAGTQLDFVIAAAYYQTTWFVAAVAMIGVTLVWAAHRIRLRIVETHEREITALNEKLMSAQEQERIRIAGELHDGVMQEMLAATMLLGTAKRRLGDDSSAHATIDKVQQKLVQAGTEIRQLSHDLHPPALQEAGLPGALRSHCEQFSATCGIPITCDADDRVLDLSRGAALALFRIVQEALSNAAKHSRATRITVTLTRSANVVTLSVSDNGVGFDRSRLTTSGGLGLITMRERAGQLNGRFEFATSPGRGTVITVEIPFR